MAGYFSIAISTVLGFMLAGPVLGQNHFADCPSRTGAFALVIVPPQADVRVGNVDIAPGDEIALFTPEGRCGGVAVWQSAGVVISAWGDDIMTDARDGFLAEQSYSFRIWQAAAKKESGADDESIDVTFTNGEHYLDTSGKYREGAIAMLSSLVFTPAVRPEPPASPVLLAPADAELDVKRDVSLTWEASTGASAYVVELGTAADFASPLLRAEFAEPTSGPLENLQFATTYHWRVKARGSDGESAWSATRTFTTASAPVATAPAVPELVAPTSGAAGVQIPVRLEWTKSEGAVSYALQVGTNRNMRNLLVSEKGLEASNFQLTSASPATTYFWRVRAVGVSGESAWSAIFSFETASSNPGIVMTAPALLAPQDGAADLPLSIELQWQQVNEAKSYGLQISTSRNFNKIEIDSSGVGTNSVTVQNLINGTTYYWRTKARADAAQSEWSKAFSFTTERSAAPQQRQPLKGAKTQSTTVTLEWEEISGAEHYVVQLSPNDKFEEEVAQYDAVKSTTLTVENLRKGAKIHWRVRAIVRGTESNWSPTFDFLTAPGLPGDDGRPVEAISLGSNFPNPFSERTTIPVALPAAEFVTLKVYNLLGEEVATLVSESMSAGRHQVEWDAANQPSGVYFARLQTSGGVSTIRLTRAR
jgi:hypothetical protein